MENRGFPRSEDLRFGSQVVIGSRAQVASLSKSVQNDTMGIMDVKPEKSIYVRTLLWAYEKQHTGFTEAEMKDALNLSDEEWTWIHWMFFNGLNGNAPLIWIISEEFLPKGRKLREVYYLSAQGIAAAVDYLELKMAQEGGKRATRIAIAAIIISIIVGIAQIIVQINSSSNNFPAASYKGQLDWRGYNLHHDS